MSSVHSVPPYLFKELREVNHTSTLSLSFGSFSFRFFQLKLFAALMSNVLSTSPSPQFHSQPPANSLFLIDPMILTKFAEQ